MELPFTNTRKILGRTGLRIKIRSSVLHMISLRCPLNAKWCLGERPQLEVQTCKSSACRAMQWERIYSKPVMSTDEKEKESRAEFRTWCLEVWKVRRNCKGDWKERASEEERKPGEVASWKASEKKSSHLKNICQINDTSRQNSNPDLLDPSAHTILPNMPGVDTLWKGWRVNV